MDGGDQPIISGTVEHVFSDFNGRRAAIIKALTTDEEEFLKQCDSVRGIHRHSLNGPFIGLMHTRHIPCLSPYEEILCLYGFPNEHWEVKTPDENVPPELPEPALGINFARVVNQEKHWMSLVAARSDMWLFSVSFHFGAKFGFNKADRQRLFDMINDLPTIYEVVTGAAKEEVKDNSEILNNRSTKSKSNTKGPRSKSQGTKDKDGLKNEDKEEEQDDYLCGVCMEDSALAEFWIGCDYCDRWFHDSCVKITSAMAKHIPKYKCSSCSSMQVRP